MKLFKFFKKETTCEQETPVSAVTDFWDLIHNGGLYYASMSMAYNLYETTHALADAVDTIVTPTKGIMPKIYKNGEIVEKHIALDLIKKPNRNQNWREFILDCAVNSLVTNNMFLVATGNVNRDIIEIYPIKSNSLLLNSVNSEGQPVYQLSTSGRYKGFNGLYSFDKNSKSFTNSNFRELIHLKGYSRSSSEEVFAMPVINPILKEIDIANGSAEHNSSLLKNGVNLSGIFKLATEDKDAIKDFQERIKTFFAGNKNVGKYIVAHADAIDFKPINATSKDMQIIELTEMAEDAVYSKYNIPKPLYKTGTQTYDNYSTAKSSLYDDAVIPLIEDIFAKLTELLTRRKMLKDGEYLGFSQNDIPALQERAARRIKELRSSYILTDNEMRSEIGYSKVANGDVIYKPSSLTSITESKTEKSHFIERMQKLGLTKEQAEKQWTK